MDSKCGFRAPVGGGGSNATTIVMCNHYPATLYSMATPSSKLDKSADNEKNKNHSQNNTKDSKTSKSSLTTKKKTRTYAPVCEASRCKFQLNVFCVDDCNWYLGKTSTVTMVIVMGTMSDISG